MQSVHFEIPPCPPSEVEGLRRELGVSAALAQVLVRRGRGDPASARAFLDAAEEHPPGSFRGIEDAVATILASVRTGARITIHGDYDVDGICSTAVLVRTLRELGADVDTYIPDRAAGYGLQLETVEMLAARGTRLLITVDCAITAVEEVRAARELGMGVVVTDHHAPRANGALPDAPIVHPAICGYPCPELCATAVAYKLAQALREASGADAAGLARLTRDLDLVALATVADVVALQGENRALLRRGLRALAATAKPGLRALMAVAGVDATRIGERAIGFGLAPRLNAAGRLYRADAGLELLLTEDARPRRGDRARARRGELRAAPDRAAHPLRGRSPDGRAGSARRLRAGGRELAPGRDRDRRLAAGRAERAPGRDGGLRRRARPRLGAQHRRLRPARRARVLR